MWSEQRGQREMGDGHDTVDGRFRDPARKPVDMVSISHYYKVLYIPGGAGLLPSTVCLFFGSWRLWFCPGLTFFFVTVRDSTKIHPEEILCLKPAALAQQIRWTSHHLDMNVQDWQRWKFFSYIEHPNCWFATRLQIWNLFLVPSTRSQQYSQHIAVRWPMSMTKNIYNSITTQPTSHTSEKHQPKHLLLRESSSRFLPCLSLGFISMALGLSPVFHWEPADDTVVTFDEVHRRSWLLLKSRSVCVFVLRFHSEDIGFRRFNFWFKFKWKGSWWKFIEPGTWSWLLRFQDHSHQSWWFHYRQRHRWKFDTSRWLICAVGSGVSWGR